jgi:hypothetical protein
MKISLQVPVSNNEGEKQNSPSSCVTRHCHGAKGPQQPAAPVANLEYDAAPTARRTCVPYRLAPGPPGALGPAALPPPASRDPALRTDARVPPPRTLPRMPPPSPSHSEDRPAPARGPPLEARAGLLEGPPLPVGAPTPSRLPMVLWPMGGLSRVVASGTPEARAD